MKNKQLNAKTFTSLTTLGLATTSHGAIQTGNSLDELVRRTAIDSSTQEDFFWDIDGNGTSDARFRLDVDHRASFGTFFISTSLGDSVSYRTTFTSSGNATAQAVNGADYGFGLLRSFSSLRAVTNSGVLDSSSSLQSFRGFTVLTTSSSQSTYPFFTNGQTIGFQFQRDDATHYGVAELSVTFGDSFGESVQLSLTNVRWNDEAGGDIRGDSIAVPEPASVGTGLGLLALGAAGLRSFRRKARAA